MYLTGKVAKAWHQRTYNSYVSSILEQWQCLKLSGITRPTTNFKVLTAKIATKNYKKPDKVLTAKIETKNYKKPESLTNLINLGYFGSHSCRLSFLLYMIRKIVWVIPTPSCFYQRISNFLFFNIFHSFWTKFHPHNSTCIKYFGFYGI